MNKNDVYKLDKPFRGFLYYHEYTDKQIESLKKLILAIANKYSINVKKQ
jgi:N-acetyl-anhydromuramyl-L-alanine amidase AmpD